MTKKHFEAFAEEIAKIEDSNIRGCVTHVVSSVCGKFNNRFDHARFAEKISELRRGILLDRCEPVW